MGKVMWFASCASEVSAPGSAVSSCLSVISKHRWVIYMNRQVKYYPHYANGEWRYKEAPLVSSLAAFSAGFPHASGCLGMTCDLEDSLRAGRGWLCKTSLPVPMVFVVTFSGEGENTCYQPMVELYPSGRAAGQRGWEDTIGEQVTTCLMTLGRYL